MTSVFEVPRAQIIENIFNPSVPDVLQLCLIENNDGTISSSALANQLFFVSELHSSRFNEWMCLPWREGNSNSIMKTETKSLVSLYERVLKVRRVLIIRREKTKLTASPHSRLNRLSTRSVTIGWRALHFGSKGWNGKPGKDRPVTSIHINIQLFFI